MDNNKIRVEFKNIYSRWVNEAEQEDKKSFGSLDGLLHKIWQESFPTLKEKLKRLTLRNEVELMKGVQESYNRLLVADENDPNLYDFQIEQEHLNCITNFGNHVLKTPSNTTLQMAIQKKNSVMSIVKDLINATKQKQISHFSYQDTIADILDYAAEQVAKVNFEQEMFQGCIFIFAFDKNFQKEFLLKIFGVSVKKMVRLHKENLQKFSLVSCLHSEFDELFNEFEFECKTADSDVRAAARFAKNIFGPIIVAQVKTILGSLVFDAVAAKIEFTQKNSMMFHILKELLTGPFVNVRDFVEDYKFFIKSWIKKKVVQFCKKDGFLDQLISARVKSYTEVIKTCLHQMTEKYSCTLETWWTWLEGKLRQNYFFFQVFLKDCCLHCLV